MVGAVQGSRVRPYVVELRLATFDDATWAEVVAALAGRVRHAAALLDGAMPEDVDDVLADCGVSLFPGPRELRTRCTCPDVANPCKHVAAVHYVLADAFDADPFLLPLLRGRDRDALLAQLRGARAAAGSGTVGAGGGADVPGVAGAVAWRWWRRVGAAGDGGVDWRALAVDELVEARGELGEIQVHPHPPDDPGAVLRRLGAPPGRAADLLPALEAAVGAAAGRAWDLLVGADPSRRCPSTGDGSAGRGVASPS